MHHTLLWKYQKSLSAQWGQFYCNLDKFRNQAKRFWHSNFVRGDTILPVTARRPSTGCWDRPETGQISPSRRQSLRQTSQRPEAIKPISDFVIVWNFNLVFRQLHTFKYHPRSAAGINLSFQSYFSPMLSEFYKGFSLHKEKSYYTNLF